MLKKMTVSEFMAHNLVSFTPDMDILDAIEKLIEHRISGAPVIDSHGNLVGIISEHDCLQVALNAAYHEQLGGKISEFMVTDVKTIQADVSIFEVADMFYKNRMRRYAVLDEQGQLVGQISRRDVLRALQQAHKK